MPDTPFAPPPACGVLELRQYTLHPGRREALIALFERAFVEPQEAAGMTLFGQFRDLDAPDRFVWLRGFADMPARAAALAAFYDGPVWRAHRDAANATMVDSDNVLLLRPAHAGSGFAVPARPSPDAAREARVVATLCRFDAPVDAATLDRFERTIAPLLAGAGGQRLATLVSEPTPNTFPRLPVREGEHVLACFTAVDTPAACEALVATLAGSAAWADFRRGMRGSETLRLAPTARSRLPCMTVA